jgi:hypothetical protein
MFSSAGDISALGRGILGNTVISPALTRRWLQPMSFVSDIMAAISSPFGIRRIAYTDDSPHRTVTAYSKGGGFRVWTSILSLIKEFNIGFTILLAGVTPGNANWDIADILGHALIPAYDAAARDEATATYGGTYISNMTSIPTNTTGPYSNSTGPKTNSTTPNSMLRISSEENKPGLSVTTWISNNTDMITSSFALQNGYYATNPVVRLYYTGLETKLASGGKRVAFKAVFEDLGNPSRQGSWFSTDCGAWVGFTGVTYAAMPLDDFIFEHDASGKVVSVTNLALRYALYKQPGDPMLPMMARPPKGIPVPGWIHGCVDWGCVNVNQTAKNA